MENFLQKIVSSLLFVFGLGVTLNAQYCAPPNFGNVEPISLVNFSDINNPSAAALGGPSHQDFTSVVGTVVASLSYNMTLKGNTGGNYTNSFWIYIDWNQDGDFLDANEMYIGGNIVNSNGLDAVEVVSSILVPATALPGTTRMRIIKKYLATAPSPNDGCTGGSTFGSTEDYTLLVINGGCMPVNSLSSSNITNTSVDINWNLIDGTQTDWIIEYGPTGFTVGSGTTIPVTSFPHTISGLNPLTTYQVYVYADCGGGDISFPSGPTSFTTLPLCPVPTAPSAVTGTFDATLSWTAGALETLWDVEWGNSGFVLGAGTQDFGLGTPTDFLNPLASSTSYHWYVRAVCDQDLTDGVDTVSYWVGPLSFTTQVSCPTPSAFTVDDNTSGLDADISWTEGNAETNWNIQWGVAGFTFGTGTIDAVSTTPSTNLSGLTPNTTYSVYLQANCGAGDESLWVGPFNFTTPIICPQPTALGISALTTSSVNTNWTGGGAESEWEVQYGLNGFTLGTGTIISGLVTTSTPITGLTSNTSYCYYVRANCGTSELEASNWAGPFCFNTIASCLTPTTLNVINITTTAANLLWQAGDDETMWNVEWGTLGFTPGNGEEFGSITATNDNPYYATGLNNGTTYSFYVQADCGSGDLSDWVGPYNFTTLCGTFTAPYMENFDAVVATPNCWTNAGAQLWLFRNSFQIGAPQPDYGVSGANDHTTGAGNFAWIDAGTIGANQLVTPTINYSSLTQPTVGFYVLSNNVNDAAKNILILEAYNGATWVQIGTYSGNNPNWVEVAFDIPGTIPTTTQFRIRLTLGTSGGSSFYNDMLIDDFFVKEKPECPIAGTATPQMACNDGSAFDISTLVTGSSTTMGTWYYPNAITPEFSTSGSATMITFPAGTGTYTFDYVVMNSCGSDTASSSVSFSVPVSAGQDGAYTTCNTFDIFLFQHINGLPQGGGTWTDDDNTGKLLNGIFKPLGLTPGDYTFTYTVAGDGTCPAATATVTITLTDCMGLEDNTNSVLSVYPNPVVDVLTITNLAITGNAEIRVLDIQGKVVFNQNVSDLNGNHLVDMSDLERGVYVIEIITENSSEKIRVIKQ